MLESIPLLGLGFLLGFKHALDADHLAAISTFTSKSGSLKKALSVGLYWGIGHTAILLLVGIILLSTHAVIPENIVSFFESVVGLMLIFLGVKNIFIHSHPHFGTHRHAHASPWNLSDELKIADLRPACWIGMVHGLAGSAALMLIITNSMHSLFMGILYIFIFGIGSILSMGLMSIFLGIPTLILKTKYSKMQKIFSLAAGTLSITIGFNLIIATLL